MLLPLRRRLQLTAVLSGSLASVPLFLFSELTLWHASIMALGIIVLAFSITTVMTQRLRDGIDALETGLLNLKDGEYSTSLAAEGNDEFTQLCALYNDTANRMRQEKQWIYQRELLLDKITQSSPEALFLVNDQGQVVFSNIAARQFFASRHSLEGQLLNELIAHASEELQAQFRAAREGLFTLSQEGQESQTWYLSSGRFNLNGQAHTLFILKQMTRELSRQEVAVWKKVIRIISHELNNSLGPISSMIHSGRLLTKNVVEPRLERVFSTIEDRISHLSDFVQGYGKFAKLPQPKLVSVDIQELLSQLAEQWPFRFTLADKVNVIADAIQLEQLLINLIKNAHESGSPPEEIVLSVTTSADYSIFELADRGVGMSDAVLEQALIPFYSTKASGSGLGLALCREITDAHQGSISLQRRNGGGLKVKIMLPRSSEPS
ncbi:sensor histidine kinase [Alteromonas flava]|uniref:sensor histidine kinase n=1 Tax=Alteromonas flava TaxID=2048003 RepID=UPI000C292116|nr:ATP-binding protein [Alteromonas flava]